MMEASGIISLINSFKTDIWLMVSDYFVVMLSSGLIVSIIVQAVKDSQEKIFKKTSKMFIWIINIILAVVVSIIFTIIMAYIKKLAVTEILVYCILFSLSTWGLSFLSYKLVIKWLFYALELLVNFFRFMKTKYYNKYLEEKNKNKNKE